MSSKNGWASVPTGTGAIGVPQRRRVAPIAGAAIAAMLVAIGLPLTATSASAIVRPGHIINVFPSRDAVNATGYSIGNTYTVKVLRGGSLMGTSLAVARSNLSPAGVAEGWLDINEPVRLPDGSQAISCWGDGPLGTLFVTPDIRPGDEVQVVDGASIDSTIVAGVTLNPTPATAYNPAGTGTLTLTGTAPGATPGSRLPVLELEARINAKNTKFSAANGGGASIRALNLNLKPGEGKLDYDTPTGNTWTATFTNMNALGTGGVADLVRAKASIQAGVWSLVTLTESTSSELGGVPAPAKGPLFGLPGCTAPAAKGPTAPIMTAGDTGVLGDFITSNPKPTFTGTTGLPDSTSASLFVDGGANAIGTSPVVNGAYSITPTTALTAGVKHTITVGETGPTAGLMLMGATSSSVTIDRTPPAVTGIFPTTTGTTMAGNVTATFNEALDPSTVTTANFTLKNAANTAVPATATFNPVTKVFTIDPFASLVAGTTYTATLTAGITDAAGNPLAVQSWSFTTATSVVASYVNRVYSDLFGRTPDAAGLAAWTATLNTPGTPRAAVANSITNSTEYRSTLITGSYLKYLGRTPDAAGINFWLAAMNRGFTVSQIEAGFIASTEYYANAGGTDATWVVKLYSDVLGRSAGATEVNFWTTRLSTNMTRGQVAMGFLLSTENLSTVVNGYYVKLLGRSLDPSGQATWVKILQAGGRNEAIIGSIISSAEYYSHN